MWKPWQSSLNLCPVFCIRCRCMLWINYNSVKKKCLLALLIFTVPLLRREQGHAFILWCRCLSEMSHRFLALKSCTVMYRHYCLTARCSGLNLMFSWQLLNLRKATALAYPQGQMCTTAPEFSMQSHIQDVLCRDAVLSWNEIFEWNYAQPWSSAYNCDNTMDGWIDGWMAGLIRNDGLQRKHQET